MNYAIIVSYNHPANTKTLVTALHRYDSAMQLALVDNKSEDSLGQWAEALSYVHYLPSTNIGYGRAINHAIVQLRVKEEDTVLVLNDDVQFEADALAELDQVYDALKPKDVVLGPVVPTYVSTHARYADRYTTYADEFADAIRALTFSPAACWLLNGRLLREIGGFDPYFFMYGEDLDYMLRCRKANIQAYQATKARVQHDFHYPPAPFKLAVEKDKNTFAARMLNGERTYFSMVRTWLGRMSRLDFVGGFAVLRGYGRFVMTLAELRRDRESRREPVQRRYL